MNININQRVDSILGPTILGVESDPKAFTAGLREEMDHALAVLNEGMPTNPRVNIFQKNGGWIAVSPFEPQAEPENLGALKAEMARRWPMTSLLDVLKETDYQVGFTPCLRSGTESEHLDRRVLRRQVGNRLPMRNGCLPIAT